MGTHVLEVFDELLQECDGLLLEFSRQEPSCAIILVQGTNFVSVLPTRHAIRGVYTHGADLLELFITLEEEREVLERNVHIWVPSDPPVILRRDLPSTERILVDLVLDLRRRVRHEDTRRVLRRRHLALRSE